jgi:hypothetical protein
MAVTVAFSGSIMTVNASGVTITFNKFADAPSSNVKVDPNKFYGAQGTAFDTYTGKDSYAFAISKLPAKKNAVKVTHYQHTSGGIKTVKSVVYSQAQLGHANDATIFKYGNQKYMFVARGGIGNKTAVMIRLSDFNKGKAKVYNVAFKKLDSRSGTDLRGITYVGIKTIKIGKKKVKRHLFIVEVGRRMNLVYLKSFKNNKAVFETIDSQRFQAPKIGSRECTAQGVTYHNGKVFVCWGDEGRGGTNSTGAITYIGYGALFKGNKPNVARNFARTWKKTESHEFTPESVYFTKLEGNAPMFMSCNTNVEDGRDYINRSTQKF